MYDYWLSVDLFIIGLAIGIAIAIQRASYWREKISELDEQIENIQSIVPKNKEQIKNLNARLEESHINTENLRDQLETSAQNIHKLNNQIKEKEQEITQLKTRMGAMQDNFTIITGIGPKVAAILRDSKINTFTQLSTLNVEKINEILEKANPSILRLVDPTTWPEQAKLAADGDWENLNSLQETLR